MKSSECGAAAWVTPGGKFFAAYCCATTSVAWFEAMERSHIPSIE